MPFPGGDLRDLERHPQPLFVLPHALMRAVERRRPLVDPGRDVRTTSVSAMPTLY